MTDIADKIYAATGLTLNAEAAAKVGHMIRLARQAALEEAARWHDENAKAYDDSDLPMRAAFHRRYAAVMRALGEKE
jgi:hypothetical protein